MLHSPVGSEPGAAAAAAIAGSGGGLEAQEAR